MWSHLNYVWGDQRVKYHRSAVRCEQVNYAYVNMFCLTADNRLGCYIPEFSLVWQYNNNTAWPLSCEDASFDPQLTHSAGHHHETRRCIYVTWHYKSGEVKQEQLYRRYKTCLPKDTRSTNRLPACVNHLWRFNHRSMVIYGLVKSD